MRTTILLACLGAAAVHSQPAPTPPIKNYAAGWLEVVSCERGSGGWALTVRNVWNTPIGYITVSGYDGGSIGEDFLGATIVGPTTPQDTYHIRPFEGLAPGASHTLRVPANLNRPESGRLVVLAAVAADGLFAGAWIESAATLAGWLGGAIQNRNIYELTKIIAVDDSDSTIDAVIERIKALADQPALTIDPRIQSLVNEPSLKRGNGAVQFAFYAAMRNAKQYAVLKLIDLKELARGFSPSVPPHEVLAARHKFAQAVPQPFLAKVEAVSAAISKLR